MKKIVYSNFTKALAVILFVVSIVSGAFILCDGILEYASEETELYNFENDFSEADFSYLLDATENAVFNALLEYYKTEKNTGDANDSELAVVGDVLYDGVQVELSEPIVVFKAYPSEKRTNLVFPITGTLQSESVAKNIEKRLSELYCADKIDYYVRWNEYVFTNCGATEGKELTSSRFYNYIERDSHGNVLRDTTQRKYYSYLIEKIYEYDSESTMVISTALKEEYVNECEKLWQRQASVVNGTLGKTALFVLTALLCLVYLICVCGKNAEGECRTIWTDNIWAELHVAVLVFSVIGEAVLCAVILDECHSGFFPEKLMRLSVGASSALAGALFLTSLLSIVRNIKCKSFVKSSIVARAILWAWRWFSAFAKWIFRKTKAYFRIMSGAMSRKTVVVVVGMLFVYTALLGICGLCAVVFYRATVFWLFVGVLLFLFACFVCAYRGMDIDEIKKGADEIRGGNLSYKIPEPKSEDMKILAENINDIAAGLDRSVTAKLKAERLKTELITNVSHDLKTPLTSIISYTELLAGVEGLPEQARDYVTIIAKKSDRLKQLTGDLFDISKAQSGNESVSPEKLDISLLVEQSMGEHDGEIKASELKFCVNTQKELYIFADGKKMSRVLGNLISNILKYTMKNTRVFVSAYESDGKAVLELKNIASYPMDFGADEIVGRFVRGDRSRSAEGNGLGLAIAKSYTELCGGSFEVIIDGDMFKTVISFDKFS